MKGSGLAAEIERLAPCARGREIRAITLSRSRRGNRVTVHARILPEVVPELDEFERLHVGPLARALVRSECWGLVLLFATARTLVSAIDEDGCEVDVPGEGDG